MSGWHRSVILAEDHTLVRAGIRSLVETLSGVEVVAETGDGQDALTLVEQHEPDVLILDITLPGLNGFEVAERVRRLESRTRVLMLSMHAGPEYVARALRAGATGYLIKDSAVEELERALDSVMLGREYLSATLNGEVVRGFVVSRRDAPAGVSVLTPRQREILQLVAEGHPTRDIAERLGISVKTVETHRAQLMERLGIHDVAGLVRFALRTGVIAEDA